MEDENVHHDFSVRATSDAYQDFAPYVRRRLQRLGIRDADLPDQCHEVFVIFHKRASQLDDIERVDLWLGEVCRRVAAGYRRRASGRLELLDGSSETRFEATETTLDDPELALREVDERNRLRTALERLDPESRDLLALHDVGEMRLSDLAKLVEHDRRTVRKRLEAARHRLSVLMRTSTLAPAMGVTRAEPAGAPTPSDSPILPALEPSLPDELEVITVTPGVTLGLLGNVVLSVWPGVVDLESLQTLSDVGHVLIERCGGKIGYLATVESSIRPPGRPERQHIVRALDAMGPHVVAYATVMLARTAWLVRPVMSGLLVLSRPRFPMEFFGSVQDASTWVCKHPITRPSGGLSAPVLAAAVERLRAVARGSN